jgi:hypothetical protein
VYEYEQARYFRLRTSKSSFMKYFKAWDQQTLIKLIKEVNLIATLKE